MRLPTIAALAVSLLAVLLLAVAGCGGAGPDICTVRGTLTFKGQPIPQVILYFEPDDLTKKSTSMAVTDAAGKFDMAIGGTPGVFKGKVKVFCDDPLAAMGAKTAVPKEVEPAYRELCAKYGRGKSTLELTIEKSDPNLQLRLN